MNKYTSNSPRHLSVTALFLWLVAIIFFATPTSALSDALTDGRKPSAVKDLIADEDERTLRKYLVETGAYGVATVVKPFQMTNEQWIRSQIPWLSPIHPASPTGLPPLPFPIGNHSVDHYVSFTPPPRSFTIHKEVVVAPNIVAIHKKSRRGTLQILLSILDTGTEEESKHALLLAIALEKGPEWAGVSFFGVYFCKLDERCPITSLTRRERESRWLRKRLEATSTSTQECAPSEARERDDERGNGSSLPTQRSAG